MRAMLTSVCFARRPDSDEDRAQSEQTLPHCSGKAPQRSKAGWVRWLSSRSPILTSVTGVVYGAVCDLPNRLGEV